jgi:hypothetical protein
MTPKEKAMDLIDKFLGDESPIAWKYEAKTIALITVDEILNIIDNMNEYDHRLDYYWEQVKQEIEKL